jgi:hypothetical protein
MSKIFISNAELLVLSGAAVSHENFLKPHFCFSHIHASTFIYMTNDNGFATNLKYLQGA